MAEKKKIGKKPSSFFKKMEESDDGSKQAVTGVARFIGNRQLEPDSDPGGSRLKDEFPPISLYKKPELSEETQDAYSRITEITEGIENKPSLTGDQDRWKGKLTIPYRSDLNDQQLAAVTIVDGPLLVIAGAGTGKTRTIIYRVAYPLERGIPPDSILLLTFTRKAAGEMLSRVDTLLEGALSAHILGGTFHSVANFLLRKYSGLLQISPHFTILDTGDSEDVVDLFRKDALKKSGEKMFPTKQRIYEIISKSRNIGVTLGEVLDDEFTALKDRIGEIEAITDSYHRYKAENNLLDYDDLIEVFLTFLRTRQDFAGRIRNRYRYIMVDEYQDTNRIQRELVETLAEEHRNVMVVGDDAQSIYAFRGATFENILRFPETYPDCRIVKIERNYRSKEDILGFTNDIVGNFRIGYKKNLFSRFSEPGKPVIMRFYEPENEAEWIVNRVIELRENEIPLSRMAVLYRASFHSNHIQAELTRRSIPYVVYGGIKFAERRHVKDIVAYLRLSSNPYDAPAWNRVLKLLPGVGNVIAYRIIQHIRESDGLLDTASFSKRSWLPELETLKDVLEEASRETNRPAEKLSILKGHYAGIIRERHSDHQKRLLDIDVLITLASRYDEVEKFLADFALDPPSSRFQDETRPRVDESEEDSLILSTVHSAKGLEWTVVFVPHLLDGLFPSDRSLVHGEKLEEERRLFYVACTRAKSRLYLTMPSHFSSWAGWFILPSRFLAEIKRDLFDFVRGEDER